jgi:NADH:ubiquinone oxidoreductase subunit
MCLSTFLYTKIFGQLVGVDSLGNSYYQSNHSRWFKKNNRWVVYGRRNKLTANIDTAWFKWLHYLSDEVPMKLQKKYPWMIENGSTEYDKIFNLKNVDNSRYDAWNPKNKLKSDK